MSIASLVEKRGIREVLHFTTNKGLIGILKDRVVLARQRLPKEATLEYLLTCVVRRDLEWLHYVNLSITRINARLFGIASRSWYRDLDLWWCVLSFRPEILSHPGVFFATTNNMYSGVAREEGEAGLEALFAPRVVQWDRSIVVREGLEDDQPTCYQAEVLYPGAVPTEFLQRLYVVLPEHEDIARAQCSIVDHPVPEIVVSPEMFT